jgi:hypothetical protein
MGTTEVTGTVVGAFRDHADAQRAVGALEQAGFSADHIGVLRKGEKDGVHEVRDHGKGAGTGVGTGLIEGGVLGAAAAFLLPGVGPVIGAGILGSIILGALTGGATGGIVGALTGVGVRKDEAEHYSREFEAGQVLVTVRAPGREAEAHQIIGRYNGMSQFKGGLPAAIDSPATSDAPIADGREVDRPLDDARILDTERRPETADTTDRAVEAERDNR